MRQAVRNLSARGEFFLVIAICFAYFVAGSTMTLLRGARVVRFTNGRVLVGIVIEIAILVAAGWILRARGFDFSRLGLRFSLGAALAGIPLFVAWFLTYWAAWLVAVSVVPAAQHMVPSVRIVPSASIAVLGAFILINSLFEEVTVTGYVMSALSEQGAGLAITASALIRFTYHLYQGPVASIAILPLGLLFAAVYWRWRNLWPLMIAHTILNVLSFSSALSGSGAGGR